MADKLKKLVHNVSTGVQEIVELTSSELAELDQQRAKFEEFKAEQEAAEQAKADAKLAAQAKLAALGLTGEEVAAITE
jgi:phage FluMu protein gp41